MKLSTVYDVCVGNGRPFKLTREMLDAIEERMKQDGYKNLYKEERMKQDDETTAATQTRTVERARKTLGWTLTLPSYLIRIFPMIH